MAYLGRPGATAPLTSADIPDNSITGAKIVADTIAAGDLAPNSVDSSELVDGSVDNSHLADDAVGTDELANDVVISTSGAITTTGAFTSVGIDDNAVGAVAITIDPDEKVSIGTTSTSVGGAPNSTDGKLNIFTNAGGDSWAQQIRHDHASGHGLFCRAGGSSASHYSALFTAGDESVIGLAILGNGKVGIGTTTPSYQFHIKNSGASWTSEIQNDAGSGTVLMNYWYTSGHAPDDRTSKFIHAQDNGANRLIMWSDGDVENHDNSYGSISDERVKEDIKDANSQWDDIKALKVRNFKRKDDVKQYGENAWEQIGLVAQEAELVSPKLVKESVPSDFELEHCGFGEQNSDGEWIPKKDSDGNNMTVKGMKYSVLYMKAIKALQEAMAKIEILEAKVTALENA